MNLKKLTNEDLVILKADYKSKNRKTGGSGRAV